MDIRYNPSNPEALKGALVPVSPVTYERFAQIPLNSEMLIINWDAGTIENGSLSETERAHFLSILRDAESGGPSLPELLVVYLPPLVTPEVAVERAIKKAMENSTHTDGLHLTLAVRSGELTGDDLSRILTDVALEAQRGVTAA